MPYKLIVNGKPSTVDVPADMPLLWVLRDTLDLKGTKYGCGIGQCGACTVHLRGVPARSCMIPVSTRWGRRSRRSKGSPRTARTRCRRPGTTSTSRSAGTARPARS